MSSASSFFPPPISAKLGQPKSQSVAESNPRIQVSNLNSNPLVDSTKDKIKKMFDKIELSVSPYDTAWVAMVPSPNSLEVPCFPECSKWIIDNQLEDGSWGLHHRHASLVKDSISSTLACVLALKQWGISERQVHKGLQFIEMNSASLNDQKQKVPVGFDITFPGMLEHAKELGLNLPLESKYVDAMLLRRDLDLKSCGSNTEGRKAYLAYISEGIGKLQDWNMVMKYQRRNGSLFNSPSATAAAFIHHHDASCLHYLRGALKKFGNAVPTIYPSDIYFRLSMVDTIESLGIGRLFEEEINSVLDAIYRYWLQGDEEIFLDCTTCAMAFRILRAKGYNVSPDKLNQFTEDHFFNSLGGYLEDVKPALELYKASQVIYQDELFLEKQISWTSQFLKQKLSSGLRQPDGIDKHIAEEVHDVLEYASYADFERLTTWRSIARYRVDETKMLKTSYCCSNVVNGHFLKLAVEDFNICQSVHREELKHLGRWIVEKRLDKLEFARQKLGYCYFSSAASLFALELSDARISWAKNGVLTTVVDDFFDVGGSEEELINLVHLIERWDVDAKSHFSSENVEIIFSALHSTICEIGEKAFAYQGRKVTSHVKKIWLDLLKSMLTEALWSKSNVRPTLDEYMTNGYTSFALGPIVLPALFFLGPKLTEEDVTSNELHNLFETMSTCGRLLNDWRSFKRESEEGKLNAVSLHMIYGNDVVTEEEAVRKIKGLIECKRREVLRLVLQEKDSNIARPCKDLFWKMTKVLHMFYLKDDGFTSDEMINTVNAVINQPISLH